MFEAIQVDDSMTAVRILRRGLDPNSRYNTTEHEEGEDNDTLLHWTAIFNAQLTALVTIHSLMLSNWCVVAY